MYAGLLVLSNIKHVGAALRIAEKYVNHLYVHLNVPIKEKTLPVPAWGKLVNEVYLATSRNSEMKVPLNMRVLIAPLKGQKISTLKLQLQPLSYLFTDCPQSDYNVCEELRKDLNIQQETIHIPQEDQKKEDVTKIESTQDLYHDMLQDVENNEKNLCTYDNVVLGGTFDRLHLGHKIFLTAAVLRAKKRLVVGVTVNEMNKSKTLYELILPVEKRIADVREFLMEIDNSLEYDILPIEDGLGPTKSDPNLDMIVVSAETERGGIKVNETRVKNNLSTLDIHVVNLVQDTSKNPGPREDKVSSSNRRMDLLGTRLQIPEARPNIPKNPYIIGFVGGIGSGKTSLAACFEKRGAAIFNCDLIAHETYEPGQSAYLRIVEHFGKRILDNGGRIDRKILGSIVFGDTQQLQKLNEIVWPEIINEVKRRIQAEYQVRKFKVAIIEAAILLQAGWDKHCHEVWAVIVPTEEAVQRVMKRNNLSEEEVRKRIESQPTTNEIVKKSHIVFSTKWDPEFTDIQAERAWQLLMTELSDNKSSVLDG